ncbi:PIN domain-containing protein [Methylovulum psychrotolerans]|uniref:PIN domain-containing protein n=1 Tax=Methylovulum psychrotolerans TaxID=1704499 RepID=UPI001BFF9438|nr:PIN domain-containing protein [Methylovulum psychrotolerans]MBT9096527.1 PIN domain-containing protein [Methylovulum psychrotolerans]
MQGKKVFLDTNLWVYLFLNSEKESDKDKQAQVKQLLLEHPSIVASTQVLNETSNTLLRKYRIEADIIENYIKQIVGLVFIWPLNEDMTFSALALLKNYHFSFYDALIVAAALQTKCEVLFSEDMQHNLIVNDSLRIVNPFL